MPRPPGGRKNSLNMDPAPEEEMQQQPQPQQQQDDVTPTAPPADAPATAPAAPQPVPAPAPAPAPAAPTPAQQVKYFFKRNDNFILNLIVSTIKSLWPRSPPQGRFHLRSCSIRRRLQRLHLKILQQLLLQYKRTLLC